MIYRAYPGERPIIRGGRRVTSFVAHRGSILKADLAAQGLKGASFKELFYAGRRLPLARYPNFDPENPYGGGWAFADGKLVPMYQDQPGEDQHTLQYKAADERTWSKPKLVEVFVFPRYNWWNNILPIKDIDRATRTIHLAADASYPIRPGDRYYFRNALEELDAPGEWFLDRDTSTLYVWPPGPLDAEHEIVAPVVGTLIAIEPGTSYLTLRGFTLEACTGEAVRCTGRPLHGRRLHDPRRRRLSPRRRERRSRAGTTAWSATTSPMWDRTESPSVAAIASR